jgi:hypothetical protein
VAINMAVSSTRVFLQTFYTTLDASHTGPGFFNYSVSAGGAPLSCASQIHRHSVI